MHILMVLFHMYTTYTVSLRKKNVLFFHSIAWRWFVQGDEGDCILTIPIVHISKKTPRVSEILPLLCCSTPLFPTPPLVSPKFPYVPLGIGGWPLSEDLGLIVHAISFQHFQPMRSWSTNVTDGRTDQKTDGQMTCEWNVQGRTVKNGNRSKI